MNNIKRALLSLVLFPMIASTVPYKLTHPLYNPGLFSVLNTVLGALEFYETSQDCDSLTVDFEDQGLYYNETQGENWLHYYFKPICHKADDTPEKKFPTYKKINFSLTAEFEMSRERGHELISKHIELQPALQEELDLFVKNNFADSYLVGVHYRGTDKKSEAPEVSYQTVSDHLRKELDQHNNVKFFIATDDADFLAFMQDEFPDKTIAINAVRSHDKKALHLSGRPDVYQRGKEAVLDCLLLSRCSKLYKMASNLSDCSIKFNPYMPVVELNQSYSQNTHTSTYNMVNALNTVLSLLDDYEHNKIDGLQVSFPVHGDKYKEPAGTNWWHYHFIPLSVGNPTDVMPVAYRVTTIKGSTNLFEMSTTRAHELITKYIKLQPHLTKKIDDFADQEFKNKHVIGVYYKKMMSELMLKLQPAVDPDQMIHQVQQEIKQTPQKHKLFLVTNDETFFNKMQQMFPDMVYIYRPNSNEELPLKESEELNLIQCVLLSKTNTIVGTASELLKTVSQFNPTVPVHTLDQLWLEKT